MVVKMKETKLQYSIKLPQGYALVIGKGKQYLDQHRDLIKNKGLVSPIFIGDVVQYALDLLADYLEIDFKNDEDLEFIDNVKVSSEELLVRKMEDEPDFRTAEFEIAGKLDTNALKEYEKDFKPKGLSLQEYVKFKELNL